MPTEFIILIAIGVIYGILQFLRSGKNGGGKILYAIVTRGFLVFALIMIAFLVFEKFEEWGIV